MDPKLLAILKKSKAVENATNAKYGSNGAPKTQTNSGSLMDEIGGDQLITAEQFNGTMTTPIVDRVDATSDQYEGLVKKSKLPPAVAQAMLKNPIPQPDTISSISEDDIRELNPNYGKKVMSKEVYSDEDEYSLTEQRHTPKQRIKQKQMAGGLSEENVKKMIAQEIARVLPKVIETYFDRKIIQENTKLMKYVIKNSKKTI